MIQINDIVLFVLTHKDVSVMPFGIPSGLTVYIRCHLQWFRGHEPHFERQEE